MNRPFATLISLFLLSNIAFAHDHGPLGAHEHGHVKLGIAVEGKSIDIDVDGPAESFLGFEYVPKTATEIKTLTQMQTLWNTNLLSVFTFPASLGCKVSNPSFKQVVDKPEEKDAHKEAGVHSDIEATAKITCNADLKDKTLTVSMKKFFPKIKKLKLDLVGTETKTIDITKPVETVTL